MSKKHQTTTGDLTPAEIDDVLHKEVVGHLGIAVENEPYVVPITYVYSGGAIYSHTYEGKKVSMMEENPKVCVQVTDMKDMCNWRSALCRGTFEKLEDEEIPEAIELLVKHLSNQPKERGIHLPFRTGGISHGMREDEHPVFYRIVIEEKTGRFETYHSDEDRSEEEIMMETTL